MLNFLLEQQLILLALVPMIGLGSTLLARSFFPKYRHEIFSLPLMALISLLIMAFFLLTIGVQTGSYYEWAETYIGTLPLSIILIVSVHIYNAYLIFRTHNFEAKMRESKERFMQMAFEQFNDDFPDDHLIDLSSIEHSYSLLNALPLSEVEEEFGNTSMPLSDYLVTIDPLIRIVDLQQEYFKKNIDLNQFEDNEFLKFILMTKNPKYSFQHYCFHSNVENMYKKNPKNTLYGHFLNVYKENAGQSKLVAYLNSHLEVDHIISNVTIMTNGETAFFDAIYVIDDHVFAFTAKDFTAHNILINFDGKMFIRQSSRDKGEVTSLVQNIEKKAQVLRNAFKNYHIQLHNYYIQTDEKTGLMCYYDSNDFNASYLSGLIQNISRDLKNQKDPSHTTNEIVERIQEKIVDERHVQTIDVTTLKKRLMANTKYYLSSSQLRREHVLKVIDNRQKLIKDFLDTSPKKFIGDNMMQALKSELIKYDYRKSYAEGYFDTLEEFLEKVIEREKTQEL